MENVLKWVVEHWGTMLVLLYGLLNLINGVLSLIPGDQGEGEGGWLSKVRAVLDRISVLTSKDGTGTVKAPLTKSKVD